MTTATDLIREYGEAIRGSWGDIDGRVVKSCLNDLASLVEESRDELRPERVLAERRGLGICLAGAGHWDWLCDDDCEEAPST